MSASGSRIPLVFAIALVCAASAADAAEILGTARVREKIELPARAVFEAILEDVSHADRPASIVGQTRIEHPPAPPISFRIPFQRRDIDVRRRYAVRARITFDGRTMFVTEQAPRVLERGVDHNVALRLVRAHDEVTSSLEATRWVPVWIGSQRVTIGPGEREPFLNLATHSSQVTVFGGCNRYSGSFERSSQALKFGPLAGTRMACPPGSFDERPFLAALEATRSWRVVGTGLELFDQAGTIVARFEARDL